MSLRVITSVDCGKGELLLSFAPCRRRGLLIMRRPVLLNVERLGRVEHGPQDVQSQKSFSWIAEGDPH